MPPPAMRPCPATRPLLASAADLSWDPTSLPRSALPRGRGTSRSRHLGEPEPPYDRHPIRRVGVAPATRSGARLAAKNRPLPVCFVDLEACVGADEPFGGGKDEELPNFIDEWLWMRGQLQPIKSLLSRDLSALVI